MLTARRRVRPGRRRRPTRTPSGADSADSYGLEFPGIGHGVLLSADCPAAIVAGFVADPTQEPDAVVHRGHARVQHHGDRRTPSAEPSLDAGARARTRTRHPNPTRPPRPARHPRRKPVKVGLVKVADGFENANGINNAGDKRLFISEQEGYVEVLKPNEDGTFRNAGKFLDIQSRVICCGEKGFLGIAFPPDYAQTGYFYVTFAGTGHTWNLEERRVSATDPDRADPDYKRRLIRVYKPLDYHWAGDMHFGADGYLYVTVGDGGFGGTHQGSGRPGEPRPGPGGHLRQDAAHRPARQPQGGRPLQRPQVQPVREDKDAQPRDLGIRPAQPVALVVRPADQRPVDRRRGHVDATRRSTGPRHPTPARATTSAGGGWRGPSATTRPAQLRQRQAHRCRSPGIAHKNGMCAVAGGYVYRGKRYPRAAQLVCLRRLLLGPLMLLNSAGKSGQKPKVALDTKSNISAFGEGADGELYMVDYGPGNTLYRVTGKRR